MAFTCTHEPKKRKVPPYGFEHDRDWELVVQRCIRDLRPPCKPPLRLWVGEDEGGLGAVVQAEEIDGADDVFLRLMAIALRLRGRGGVVGQFESAGP